jgi:2-keto-4-pentenoate hydratase
MATAVTRTPEWSAAVAAATAALVQARRHGEPTAAAAVPLPDADAAYAVQDAVAAALGWAGAEVAGPWKIGTAPMPLHRTHARLPPAGVWASPASAAHWPLHMTGIEAEVAFRLAYDLAPEQAAALDPHTAAQCIDAFTVSIEIVDSRWVEGLKAPALNALADLQSHGALVLGEWVPFVPRDWPNQDCHVAIGSRLRTQRRASHVLLDPTLLLADWMRHTTREGAVLPAGSVVTTGSWVGILEAARGERVEVEFPGIGVASLQL